MKTNRGGLRIIEIFDGAVDPGMVSEAESWVEEMVEVPLLSNQFSAMVSFALSVERSGLKTSKLLKAVNDCFDDPEALRDCAQFFNEYVYSEHRGRLKEDNRLISRRNEEKALWLMPSLEVNRRSKPSVSRKMGG